MKPPLLCALLTIPLLVFTAWAVEDRDEAPWAEDGNTAGAARPRQWSDAPHGEPPAMRPPPLPPEIREQGAPPRLPPNLPNPEEMREQFLLLKRFLELPPERLAQIRETLERIEQMEPERKQAMLEKIADVQISVPSPRDRMTPQQGLVDATPAELQDEIKILLEKIPPRERRRLDIRVREFTDEATRQAYIEGLAEFLRLSEHLAATAQAAEETQAAREAEAVSEANTEVKHAD